MGESLELRWGSRFESGLEAELRSEDGFETQGILRNVSLSGAFIETALEAPPFSRMYMRPRSSNAHWMPAYTIRSDQRGLAVEWVHPGMAAIRSWLPLPAWHQSEPTADASRHLHAGTR